MKPPALLIDNLEANRASLDFAKIILEKTQQVFVHGSSNHYIDRNNPKYDHVLLNIRNSIYIEYKYFIFEEIRKILTTPQIQDCPETNEDNNNIVATNNESEPRCVFAGT